MIERIGRYRIVERLGEGAMSVVYRGYDPSIHRIVAIKTLRPEYAHDDVHRARFLTEARAAGTLAHPGIVTVYDVGESEGVPFIAMELLEGMALDRFVAAQPDLSLRTSLRIAIQVAEALDYAHRKGVVHRDIKPENIVCRDAAGNVKVTDFGIAQVGQGTPPDDQAAGTPHYVAPEVLRGQRADSRADLYSLGVLLYWMLSGQLPYQAASVPELLQKIVDDDPAPLVSRHAELPRAARDVVANLLEKSPDRRYQNAEEVIEDLQRIDDRVAERERNWSGERIVPIRVRWTAIMSALVALTVGIGLFAVHRTQERVARDLAFDYGFTLTRQLTLQSAEDLLLDDRIAVQALTDAMAENREIAEISIGDRLGRRLASSGRLLLTTAGEIVAPDQATLLRQRGDVRAYLVQRPGDSDILLFDSPVEYDGRGVGRLQLGLSTEPLVAASRATVLAMLGLAAVTLLAVLIGAYVLSRKLMVPVEIVRRALWKIAQGRFDSRIRLQRRDEFERVFSAFNAMAESLQARLPPGTGGDVQADGNSKSIDGSRPGGDREASSIGGHPAPDGRDGA
ncbi:MAG: protein kinase [Xanthomonadaceae bacterium]|nr:protein kinase [Xanthomonadaceae bacterium]